MGLTVYEIWEHGPESIAARDFSFLMEIILVGALFLFSMAFVLLFNTGDRRRYISAEGQQDKVDEKGTDFQRVLVINNSSLLVAGIESLLNRDTSLEIFSISTEDEKTLIEEIRRFQPNVIILEEFGPPVTDIKFLSLFEYCPALRVVGVSTESGRVRTYDKNQVTINQVVEFVKIIGGKDMVLSINRGSP